ncbi:hypothetical protein CBS147331_4187 [Penicillium roqueforti]|nr:hypothetical protein CBS147331_4187 [Penicillium roqueforti]
MIPLDTSANSPYRRTTLLYIVKHLAVVLRLASTHIRRRGLKIHDYLIFFSLVLLTGYVVDMLIGATTSGYGGHTATMAVRNPGELVSALKVPRLLERLYEVLTWLDFLGIRMDVGNLDSLF